jgi:hypothetical protein
MKVPSLHFIILAGYFSLLSSLASPPALSIASPDHPPVWYNRTGDKLTQYLEWSNSKDQLVLHVAYSSIPSSPEVWSDQYYIDKFKLSFPTVRLDRSQNRLYFANHGHEITVGHLDSGILGTRVELENNVELSAHRSNGVLHATIRSVNSPSR